VPFRHTLCYPDGSEVFRLGRREEREAQGGSRHRVRGRVFHIERGDLLDILEHPNPKRYAGQRVFVVQREEYVYLVPFVEDEHMVFLKTIIPSQKATKQYLGEEPDDQ
jgi:hypothetical protein